MKESNLSVLITGAGRGLGLHLTRLFLSRGDRVFAITANTVDGLQQLQESFPDSLHYCLADVSHEDDVRNAQNQCARHHDSLDIIINNAAVHLENDRPDIAELDFDRYTRSFQVNSIGPLCIVKHFLPMLRDGERKQIISISSEAGSIGQAWRKSEYSYCMSKSALNMGMQILHNRLKPEGISVLLIHPGWVRTDMGGDAAHLSGEESAAAVANQILTYNDEPIYIDWEGKALPW